MKSLKTAPDYLPFNRPRRIDIQPFLNDVEEVFDSRWFTNAGPYVTRLEAEIAELHQVKHCIVISNGTLALQLALRGLELKGKVLTTPFTFVATAHAAHWEGLQPVFCDIDPETLTISAEKLRESMQEGVSAVLGVHVFGQFCDVDGIKAFADARGLKVIYDAAHSFMTAYRGVSVGNFGDAEVLSFHATKLFHTFEGGAVLTNRADLAEKLKSLKNFGFAGMDNVQELGTNAKLNEISAAFGVNFLPHMPETVSRLGEVHRLYRKGLEGIPGIRIFTPRPEVQGNHQYHPILVDEKQFGISRDALWAFLWHGRIQTRRYFYPLISDFKPYKSDRAEFPVATAVARSVLCLPCYYDLRSDQVESVCERIRQAASEPERLMSWFSDFIKSSSEDPFVQPMLTALKREHLPN